MKDTRQTKIHILVGLPDDTLTADLDHVAYELGHACGWNEVNLIADDLADAILPLVAEIKRLSVGDHDGGL